MIKLHKWTPALAAAGLALFGQALHAEPVLFGISAAVITRGGGYGIDNGNGQDPENGGTLLDVRFPLDTPSIFSARPLPLAVGEQASFGLATVMLGESDGGNGVGNAGIRLDAEQDGLGVTATLTFTGPLSTTVTMTGSGTATNGRIDDPAVDYVLAWAPLDLDFGLDGRFRLSMDTLSFSQANEQHGLQLTVERLAAPGSPLVAAVPEPASMALAGLGLALAGLARRRRPA